MQSTSSLENLKNFANAFPSQGLHSIKLKDLLNLRASENLTRDIVTSFPPAGIGSITLVDQIVLLCMDELIQPESILEIGTFQGFTTKLFAMNSGASVIFSVDLPLRKENIIKNLEPDAVLVDGDYNDDYLRDVQNQSGELYLAHLPPEKRKAVRLVKQDSTTLNFQANFGKIDLCFVDGGHHYDVVKSDTEKALGVMTAGVIVWHDFSSVIHSDVTSYVTERSVQNRIFHVNGSLCAFQVVGI